MPDRTQPRQAPARLHVVVIGAGFGGLECARALRRAPVDVTILDRRNHHLFQPLLYQVATAALSPGDIAWPIRSAFRGRPRIRVLMAEVTGVDVEARTVSAAADPLTLRYDLLVVATGARHAYFGHDDWAPYAPGLKTIEDATELRRRLLIAFERAELTAPGPERDALLTFVIVGGGPTGVEMSGAAAELARHTLRREFRRVDPGSARIVLVEAGPRLLPALPEELSQVARRSLEGMKVEVRTGQAVTRCDAGGVTLGGQEHIAAGTVIWAAGVAASPAASWLGAERDRAGRVRVEPDLSLPGRPGEVFVIGDTAAAVDADGRPVPGIAPAAKQMGWYVARVIKARIAGRPHPGPFRYRHHGDLAVIGRRSAVVALDRIRLTGVVAWWFWGIAHIYYLIGFRSRIVVSFNWFWSYLTFQRGARLITATAETPGRERMETTAAAESALEPARVGRPGDGSPDAPVVPARPGA